MSSKKTWVIKYGGISDRVITYVSVEQDEIMETMMLTVEVNHAKTFTSQKAAVKFRDDVLDKHGEVVQAEVDMKVNREYMKKKLKDREDLIRLRAENEQRIQKEQDEWDEAYQKEKLRLANLKCPCCKNQNLKKHTQYQRLDTYNMKIGGPARPKQAPLVDHYICQDCGVHFSDVKKVDLGKRPGGGGGGVELPATLDVTGL